VLKFFEQKFNQHQSQITAWLNQKRAEVKNPVYCSVDLRNSGFKISVIDANLFPGGWNNLCRKYEEKGALNFKNYLQKYYPGTKKILIFPEAHTKNIYYFQNLKDLKNLIQNAGLEIVIGHNNEGLKDVAVFETAKKEEVILYRVQKDGNLIKTVENFVPDLILANNDFSNGLPVILENIKQPIVPNPNLGWFKRDKINNIKIYQSLIEEFALMLDLDPWFFYPISQEVKNVNFQTKKGFEEIFETMNKIFIQLEKKYDEYKLQAKPYIFIKNSTGTYGMGVKNFESVEDFLNINRKDRNTLSVGKGSQKIENVIIQEGLPTTDRLKSYVAEPVIYLINSQAVGGFFRLNSQKSDRENLNSKGMHFSKLCFHEMQTYQNTYCEGCDIESLQKIYAILAEIASIAGGVEERDS